jgi:alpha-N-arabinofuranosidase
MVFHAVRDYKSGFPHFHNRGRETCLAPMSWSDDGWPVVNENGTVSLEMTANCLPSVPAPSKPNRDDFDTNRVDPSWNFLRNPNEEDYSFSTRAGWLALRASPVTLDVEESPTFLGRRQQHMNCRALTLVDFEPSDADEAGLTVFMNNRHHYEIALRRKRGRRHVFVRRRIGELSAIVNSMEVPAGLVRLAIRADNWHYHFAFSRQSGDWHEFAKGETRYLSTEVAGGFTGVYFGLYATSNGTPGNSIAYFDWFDYEALDD